MEIYMTCEDLITEVFENKKFIDDNIMLLNDNEITGNIFMNNLKMNNIDYHVDYDFNKAWFSLHSKNSYLGVLIPFNAVKVYVYGDKPCKEYYVKVVERYDEKYE